MFRPRTELPAPRRGIILLVVLFLLTLFAIVGISFVLYADASAHSSRLYRDSESLTVPDVEPELLLAHFLGQLIYDANDDETGVYSALRGHSLFRNMYGWNSMYNASNGTWSTVPSSNLTPYNGTGRLHYPSLFANDTSSPPDAKDDYYLINYTYFRDDPQVPAPQRFLRDPERYGWRFSLAPTARVAPYTGGSNVPYTYPDLNNLFLAAVKADGTVLMPSFHRPWLFGSSNNPGTNPNWTNKEGKYLTLRPRPIDHDPTRFPYPEDATGDVKNLIGAPGGNDSYWIDLGYPVLVAKNGVKYKPLFAPLIIDLDNRVNINVHGNHRGRDGAGNLAHASNQGWGRWEVNLGQVLDRGNEWTNLLVGNPAFASEPYGRYGRPPSPAPPAPSVPGLPLPGAPGANNNAPSGRAPRFYGQVDYDGHHDNRGPSKPVLLPGVTGNPDPSYFGFPHFDPASYGNGNTFERRDHPLLFNPFPFAPPRATTGNHVWRPSTMEALLRYGQTGTQALTSELFRLCPQNFGDTADPAGSARRRRLVTTHSFDYDRPGLTPWVWDPTAPTDLTARPYRLPNGALSPVGDPIPFPPLRSAPPSTGDFDADWQARIPPLGRLDLNRTLPDYPTPNATSGRITPSLATFLVAQEARRQLAADVFEQLRRATALPAPTAAMATAAPEQFNALRWLAQLAVNVVDYIDSDDYMTPYNWIAGTPHWVFGTELPRVVINETYAERTTDPTPTVKVWVELHNPFAIDPTLSDNGAAKLYMPAVGSEPAYGIYQLVLAPRDTNLRQPDNVLGNPARTYSTLTNFLPATGPALPAPRVPYPADPATVSGIPDPDPRFILPANKAFRGPNAGNRGFYVVGPDELPGTGADRPKPTLLRREMSYSLDGPLADPTILLRRLACPHLLHNPLPGQPGHLANAPVNPYVTVDYVENVPAILDSAGVEGRLSVGRNQPYAAHPSQLRKMQPLPRLAGQPQHTFFRHNAREATVPLDPDLDQQTLKVPFDWLVHLDRQLISPMELLHVSAFKPHELTQQFVVSNSAGVAQPFSHRAPWYDQNSRLYRVFEFLETHDRAVGMQGVGGNTTVQHMYPAAAGSTLRRVVPVLMGGVSPSGVPWRIETGSRVVIGNAGSEEVVVVQSVPDATSFIAPVLRNHGNGTPIAVLTRNDRVPGRINLNTVWDVETFRALCDAQAQPGHSFSPADVDRIFGLLMGSRTPNANRIPGRNDRPFRGMAPGLAPASDPQYPLGSGIEDTLFRSADPTNPGGVRLFGAVNPTAENAHPYLKDQLLTKLFNNVTSRSNVFAVWVTVGFFEVVDDNVRPAKLGAEVGRAEGRHIRRRMFAIVDRTFRTTATATSGSNTTTSRNAVEPGSAVVVFPVAMPNLHPGDSITARHVEDVFDPITGEQLFDPVTGQPVRRTVSESVAVISVNPLPPAAPTSFTARFNVAHPEGFTIVYSYPTAPSAPHNNAGPRVRYNPRDDPGVVLHFSIIQ